MKLRNKETGEILPIGNIIVENPEKIDCGKLTKYSSLAELNDEWEDYSPKVFYYINENGGVLRYIPSDPEGEDETYIKYQKEIGNHFESREEAEKAVERLRAWKRLKDFGCGFILDDHCAVKFIGPDARKITSAETQRSLSEAYKLLFGGEE